jgi:formylglycine-generating enzyme required for sulfatase activity
MVLAISRRYAMKKVYKQSSRADDPEDFLRIRRGGRWYNYASALRAAYRNNGSPSCQDYYIGVRSIKEVEDYEKSV